VAPRLDIREQASAFINNEPRHYFAQMQAYQSMPDEAMFTIQDVVLNTPIEQIVSKAGVRVNCEVCGEEIMNERQIYMNGTQVCRTCANKGYYLLKPIHKTEFFLTREALLMHQN